MTDQPTHDARAVECAVAIRMTCRNPARAGDAAGPVAVTFDGETGGSAHALLLPADVTPEALADLLTTDIRAHGKPPAAVTVDGVGTFSLRAEPPAGRLAGCVAIVTGSAQGFGQGIADELAREGARVVVADLKEELGQATADMLNETVGSHTALFAKTDVTDLASLEGCVRQAVLGFGGVDMFISNAGVLKAGGIEEMDEAAFDLVTCVNYKGYFLGVKAVTPVLKLQHRLYPEHFMDIIQVNSKSGLSGSNRNFAYAGGKFGGIGLTQSFALELIPSNIRVNAVCPGNFFDGPLWSDPQRGLFVQYLQAGKVPGAKTIDDVRQFYLDKVPMRRGCLPSDVARAIFYIHEQTYETGQAIPVTGGQEMLK